MSHKLNDEFLPKTDYAAILRKNRNVYDTIERVFDGDLEVEELGEDERRVYERVVELHYNCTKNTTFKKGSRFDRPAVLQNHMDIHRISFATANRDLQLVNKQMLKYRESEQELRLNGLLDVAHEAVEIAMTQQHLDPEVISKVAKNAWEMEGMKTAKSGGDLGLIHQKIEQHVNIFVMSDRSEDLLQQILEKNISVIKHATPIEEILEYERVAAIADKASDSRHSPQRLE